MACHRKLASLVAACTAWLGIQAAVLHAQEKEPHWTSANLPLNELPADVRERVQNVVDHPALYTRGPAQEFPCDPATYFWLLDHPDRATLAWRRLGARCIDIQDAGDGNFCCNDPNGDEVHWTTVYHTARMRIWYAEGAVKPATLLKPVSGKAVVVVRHIEGKDEKGRSVIREQTDMILHADSKTATFVAKVLGASMPQLAEQYVAHLGNFFSLLAIHLGEHPERAARLLAEKTPQEAQESPLALPTSPGRIHETMKYAIGTKQP